MQQIPLSTSSPRRGLKGLFVEENRPAYDLSRILSRRFILYSFEASKIVSSKFYPKAQARWKLIDLESLINFIASSRPVNLNIRNEDKRLKLSIPTAYVLHHHKVYMLILSYLLSLLV